MTKLTAITTLTEKNEMTNKFFSFCVKISLLKNQYELQEN